jgi:hypothetical protein
MQQSSHPDKPFMTWNDLIKLMAVRQIHLTMIVIVKPLGSPPVLAFQQ